MATARELEQEFEKEGVAEDEEIVVDVSYQIIRQVSAQLYTNPRKAVEELVSNCYDAGAKECYVNTPESKSDYLAVLDNGVSMDMEGFQWLWSVAKSPKQEELGGDRVQNGRKQIGKFGVGKLAAFALGSKLTHIAAKNGNVRIISVSEEEVRKEDTGNPPSFEVNRVDFDEAEGIISDYFKDKNLPNPWEREWKSWTLAIVDNIEEEFSGQALQPQYLHQMIRTAIPLSSQFEVYLNSSKITQRDPDTDERFTVSVLDEDVRDDIENKLQSFWRDRGDYDDLDGVPEEKYECTVDKVSSYDDVAEDVQALIVPELGPVHGEARYFEDLLTKGKRKERGLKDHGFRVTVKGKLVNREDPLFGLDNPSYGHFGRFLAQIEVPGLDDAILVQRNQVSENEIETHLTREVLSAIFNYSRREAKRRDRERLESSADHDGSGGSDGDTQEVRSFGTRLNTLAPFDATQGLRGLTDGEFPDGGLGAIEVEFSSYDEADEITYYSSDDEKIRINEDHPLFQALADSNKLSEEFKQVFGEAVAGNLLATGYLNHHGVNEDLLDISKSISDDSLRSAAGYIRDEIQYYIDEIHDASLEGGTRYEKAVVDVLRSINVATTHRGASDEPDGILSIPRAGEENFKASIEAKGSQGIVNHEDAKEATVSRHKEESGCHHAVVIAREFQTDGKGQKDSALLREMIGNASLLNNAAIEKLLRLHKRRRFTHQQIINILINEENPEDLVGLVEDVWEETPEPGVLGEVLEIGWEAQKRDRVNKPPIGVVIGDERIQERELSKNEVASILEAAAVSTGLVDFDRNNLEFELYQKPEVILEQMSVSPE